LALWLLYAYGMDIISSQQAGSILRQEEAWRMFTVNHQADHEHMTAFRSRNSATLEGLLVQMLGPRQKAEIVKLGHGAPVGARIQAMASK
jgi:hypothetical protein